MTGLDLYIEKKHHETGISYIDIVCEFAEEKAIDFEDLKLELHENIIDKIKQEFIELNMVKGEKNDTSLKDFL